MDVSSERTLGANRRYCFNLAVFAEKSLRTERRLGCGKLIPSLYSRDPRSVRIIHTDIEFSFPSAIHLDDLLLEVHRKLLTLVGGLITQANIIELPELIR